MVWTVEIHFKDISKVKTVHETEAKLPIEVLAEIIKTGMLIHPEGKAIYVNNTEIKTLSITKGSRDFIETRKRPTSEARSFPAKV